MIESKKKLTAVTGLFVTASLVLSACQQAAPAQKIVETVVVTSAPEIKEVVKETVKEVVVTATPDPAMAAKEAPAMDKKKVLRVNTGAFPDNIDPQKASFVSEIGHLKLIYEGLMKFDTKLATVPGSAEKYDVNANATAFTFTLRSGLKYADGAVLNAKRFEYSIIRNINPATAGEYGTVTNEVAGAPEWQDNYGITKDEKADAAAKKKAEAAAAAGEKLVRASVLALGADGAPCKDYEQADCLTLAMRLSKPAPYWPTIMALWVTFPAKEENINNGKYQDWFNYAKYQVGNGPFKMTTITVDERAEFVPNESYYGGAPKYSIEYSYIKDSAVAFQAYKNNEFDIVGLAAEDLAAVENDADLNTQKHVYPGSCTTALQFRNFAKPFDDPKVRQAFASALDRDRWVKDVLKGLGSPTQTWIPNGYPGYKEGEKRFAYDMEKAKALIAESTYKSIEGLPPLILTFSDTPRNRVRNEWLAARFQEVFAGIKVELKPVEPTAFTAAQKDKNSGLQMFIGGWCADYPDPQNWLSVYFNSKTTFANRIGFKDDAFDKLTEQADAELDAAKRADMYQQAQDKLVDDVPVAFFWNNVNAFLVKPWVTGISQTPQDGLFSGDVSPTSIDIDLTKMP